jgi:hypothetical protein
MTTEQQWVFFAICVALEQQGSAGDLRRQVLVDREQMQVGRIDGLIEGKRPARDLSTRDLGGNLYAGFLCFWTG